MLDKYRRSVLQLARCEALVKLDLWGCRGVTSRSIDVLTKARPRAGGAVRVAGVFAWMQQS